MSTVAPEGKGIFIWKSKNCADGTIGGIVEACKRMGLSWVALKIGDDASTAYASFRDMVAAVEAFKDAGLRVWGWHYIYGGIRMNKNGQVRVWGPSPVQEAEFAARQVRDLHLDGYIIDAEKEYKVHHQAERASQFMRTLLRGIHGQPIALCSYRYPDMHLEFPWETFLDGCQVHMPQVYWSPGRAVAQLDESMAQLSRIRRLPFAPAGRAYIGDGYPAPGPSGQELVDFMQRAEDRGCPGVNFWALDFLYLHEGGEERAAAIEGYGWGKDDGPEPEPEPGPVEQPLYYVRVTMKVLNLRTEASSAGQAATDCGDLTYDSRLPVGDELVNAAGEKWLRMWRSELWFAGWLVERVT